MTEGTVVGVVLVNYRSFDETVDYVKHEISKIRCDYRVVIVNNSSTDALDAKLCSALNGTFVDDLTKPIESDQHVFIFSSAENLGYARGNNLGSDFLTRHFAIDWLLITNNDLLLSDADVVEHLIALASRRSDVGIVGPRIVCPRGTCQSPHRKMTIFSHVILPCFFFPVFWVFRKFGLPEEVVVDAEEGDYHRVMGSFMLVKANAFRAVGGFDPSTFLYGEELILSERMREVGYSTLFSPARTVVHDHGTTIKKFQAAKESQRLQLNSILYYYRQYRSASGLSFMLAKVSIWVHLHFYVPVLDLVRFVRDCCQDFVSHVRRSVQ